MTALTSQQRSRIGALLDEAGVSPGPIADEAQLTGGTQNVLVGFRRGQHHLVLRRPAHPGPAGTTTIAREARILAALGPTPVPHPRLVAACTDPDLIGVAFLVMEHVDGTNPTVALPARYREDRGWRHDLGLDLARVAATVGEVDWGAVGLADLGRPEGFLERQVPRWRDQLDSYRDVEGYPPGALPHLDAVAAWLEAHRPTRWRPGLMHGDLHFANVLVHDDAPSVAAVIDWEIATIGDPLLDLGTLLALWPDGAGHFEGPISLDPGTGLPSAAEVVTHYARHSTRDVGDVLWYEVMACYRLAVLLEGTHARAWGGRAPMETGRRLHRSAVGLMERAARRASGRSER